jgi:hypothetical protein
MAPPVPVSVPVLFLAAFLAFYVLRSGVLRPYLKFFWHCFIRPIGLDDQKARLDKVFILQRRFSCRLQRLSIIVLSGPSRRV